MITEKVLENDAAAIVLPNQTEVCGVLALPSQTEVCSVLALEGMTCASCAMRIEKGLKKIPGVQDVSVNFATEQATVTYVPIETNVEQMKQKVEALGYLARLHVPPAASKGATSD